jgi:hypothetical protein
VRQAIDHAVEAETIVDGVLALTILGDGFHDVFGPRCQD